MVMYILQEFKSMCINDIPFRSERYQRSASTDLSGIKCYFHEAESREKHWCYGLIKNIFRHNAWEGDDSAPKIEMIEAEWFSSMAPCDRSKLPRIVKDPGNSFNVAAKFAHISTCYPQNIVFWPTDPWDSACTTFNVIDRGNQYVFDLY